MERADPGLRLADLQDGELRLLHAGRNVSKAEVRLLVTPRGSFAVKDYRRRPAWVRGTIGRWCLRREERAYRALGGVQGIPSLAGRPHPLVLVTAFVAGPSLAEWERGRPLPDAFFGRLKQLLEEVHGRGVVQGDLHHRDVLVGADGRPWLVDFSTAMTGGPGGRSPRGWLWRLLQRLDRRAVLKLQERFAPGTLSPGERGELQRPPWVHRLLRGRGR